MVSVPEGLAIIAGAAVGATVGAGADVALAAGTAVGAGAEVAPADGAAVGARGTGVAVADEPQAKIAASIRTKGPRIITFGFLNQ